MTCNPTRHTRFGAAPALAERLFNPTCSLKAKDPDTMTTVYWPTLTDDELDAIRKRAEQATPGPWISFIEGRNCRCGFACSLLRSL